LVTPFCKNDLIVTPELKTTADWAPRAEVMKELCPPSAASFVVSGLYTAIKGFLTKNVVVTVWQ